MESSYSILILVIKSVLSVLLFIFFNQRFKKASELFYRVSSRIFFVFIAFTLLFILLKVLSPNKFFEEIPRLDFIDFILVCQVAVLFLVRERKK
ncbi:MAG: hypothetical protein JW801_08195 [Bacteroidales bacterium]|nr:hypothetical protein [Bacteroidales bacterium]